MSNLNRTHFLLHVALMIVVETNNSSEESAGTTNDAQYGRCVFWSVPIVLLTVLLGSILLPKWAASRELTSLLHDRGRVRFGKDVASARFMKKSTPNRNSFSAHTLAAVSSQLQSFTDNCSVRFDNRVDFPQWGVNHTLSSDYLTHGDRVMCTRGRSLYRPYVEEGTWFLARGNAVIRTLTPEVLAEAPNVSWHSSVGVITTPIMSMFHVLNDIVLPLHEILRIVFQNVTHPQDAVVPLDSGPLDYVMLHVDGTPRSNGSEEIAVMTMETIVPDGGSLRVLMNDTQTDSDTNVHCYCRTILQPPSSLLLVKNPQSYIYEGDPVRRRATGRVKWKINSKLQFLPYGSYPIPPKEYITHGLWANESIDPRVPRLLLLLRKSTRLLGNVDEMVTIARSVGFNVMVFTPESHPIPLQARAARYADVMVAVHGQALTWLLMMDGVKATSCREVLELQHYGRPFKRVHNVYELLASDSRLKYRRIPPSAVSFDESIENPTEEKRQLNKKSFPHLLRGFFHQTVFFQPEIVHSALSKAFQRVSQCLWKNKPVKVPKSEKYHSEPFFKASKKEG